MKRFHLCAAAIFICVAASSQTTYTWIGDNNDSWTSRYNWSPQRSDPDDDDILRFNDGSSKTIVGVPSQTIGKLLVTNNTGITLRPSSDDRRLTVGGQWGDDLVIEAGSRLTIGPGEDDFTIRLSSNSSADISGTLVITKDQEFSTNSSGDETIVSATGVIQNSGTISSNEDRLIFEAGATYEHAQNDGDIPRADWDEASNTVITGVTNSAPDRLDQSFGNFTWNCPNQSSNINFRGDLTDIRGNFTVADTRNRAIVLGSDDNVTLTVRGNLTIGSAGNRAVLDMDDDDGNIRINLHGNLVTLGSGQIDNGGDNDARLNFVSNSGIQYINLGNPNSFTDDWEGEINIGNGSVSNTVVLQTNLALSPDHTTTITVEDGSTLNMGDFVISNRGEFNAESGSTLMIGHAGGISASGNTGNVRVSGDRSYSTGANYAYSGSVAQITGMGLPTTVRRLTIDNSTGVGEGVGVSLSRSTAISTQLVLRNGYLQTTASNMLTVNNGATALAENNAFVAGPMRKTGNSSFVFPTGWAGLNGGRIPIGISSLSTSRTMQAEYKRLPSKTVGANIASPLHHVSACEYWELFPTSGSVNATITMNWNGSSNCGPASYIDNFSSLMVARSNGSTWTSVGNNGGSMASHNIVSNTNTTMSNGVYRYFTLSSTNSAFNPLPVLFGEIKVYEKNNGQQVEWSMLTEKDILHYIVERSSDGKDFTGIETRLPASNQSQRADYTSFDGNPVRGVSYYRIKAVESTGGFVYSKIVRITAGSASQGIMLYPNPLRGNQLTLEMTGVNQGSYTLRVVSSSGQEIYQKAIIVRSTNITQVLSLPGTIRPGVYTLLINGNGYRQQRMFLVQ